MNTYQNKLYIIANLLEKRYYKGIKECIKALSKSGFDCMLDEEDYKKLYKNEYVMKFSMKDADYICSLGGDGTLLLAGQYAIKYNKPLFGINFGKVGYLCAYEKGDIDKITPQSLAKKKINKEPLLEFKLQGKTSYSINDVIIGKADFGTTISIEAKIANQEICSYRGDGVIVSTPLGSSAYNHSCGGPKLARKSNQFVATAICPNMSDFRYKRFADNLVCEIKLNSKRTKANIYSDGKLKGELKKEINIYKSKKVLRIIR